MLLVILMMRIIFLHKLLLTNTQVSMFCKAFANNSSGNIKLSKSQLHKIRQSGGLLGRLLGLLLKTRLPLMKNVLKPLAKSVLIPLGLTTAAAADADIHKKMFGSGITTLIIVNKEMNNIMRITTSLEESSLLVKGISEIFIVLRILLGTLGASLLGNILTGKDTITASDSIIGPGHDF